MRQDKKLSLLMGLLFLIVIVSFGLIVVNEKASIYNIPKIDKKLNTYIKNKYPNIKVTPGKTMYKAGVYKLKVVSTKNNNLYFYVIYKNKKITSTYKNDYLKGKTLLNEVSKDLSKEIAKKTKYKVSIKMNNTLNNYNFRVKERIIKEDNIIGLSIYNVHVNLDVHSFNENNIYNEISKLKSSFKNNGINPRKYNLTIFELDNPANTISINNLDSKIENDELKLIISDIMKKKEIGESDILNKYNITYQYID